VLDRLEELVVKPVDGSGGKGIVIGPRASRAELDALRNRVTEDPRGWIAQPVVQLSTVPTLIEDRLRPRHVDLRPFAVNSGDSVWVLPGGLTRVALPEGELVVNSSQGGGSKDTWVLSPFGDQASADEPGEGPDDVPSPPHAPVEEDDEIDDHGPPHTPSPAPPAEEEEAVQKPARPAPAPPTRVPLTVSTLPMTVLPRREPTPRQQEEQQQQDLCSIARSARADPALRPTTSSALGDEERVASLLLRSSEQDPRC
jgi:circularly permuted ATPgrasp domain protein